MKETVITQMSRHCIRARNAELPLILLDTMDVELALEIGLHCGALTPLPRDRGNLELRYQPYYSLLTEETSLQYEADYKNMFSSWDALPDWEADDPLPGMYVLKLDQQVWYQQEEEADLRINLLRQYVQAFVQEPDGAAPVRSSCILLYGDVSLLPEDLLPYTEIIEEPYPDSDEIRDTLLKMASFLTDEAVIRDITLELAGFSRHKLRTLLRGMINSGILPDPEQRKKEILEMKKQFLLQTGDLLTLELPPKEELELGGMEAYRQWIEGTRDEHGNILTAGISQRLADPLTFTLERGIPAMKGVLLCGVPGCGKSEAARVLHQLLNRSFGMPMVKMSVSKLMGGIVGESERRMRTALKQADAMAPCILFIDEIDKGFSGAGTSADSDSGAFKRMFGDLLSWMQRNDKGCFIFATANDISQLPPEFFRSGRFDALYSVFLPTQKECLDIFRVHMERADERRKKKAEEIGRNPDELVPLFQKGEDGCSSNFILHPVMDAFVYDSSGQKRKNIRFVSGADIEKIVKDALAIVPLSGNSNGLITPEAWREALLQVINSPTLNTQGGSIAGLNAIAECYLRLLRGNFIPVSSERQTLLKQEDFAEEDGQYHGNEPEGSYDSALYQALIQRINQIVPVME